MAATSDRAAWQNLVEEDIATLSEAGIQPTALKLRMQELCAGRADPGSWPEFKAAGRGISNCCTDVGTPSVTLEFRHRNDAAATRDALMEIRDRFKAITSIGYREHGKNGASVAVRLTPPPPDGEESG